MRLDRCLGGSGVFDLLVVSIASFVGKTGFCGTPYKLGRLAGPMSCVVVCYLLGGLLLLLASRSGPGWTGLCGVLDHRTVAGWNNRGRGKKGLQPCC